MPAPGITLQGSRTLQAVLRHAELLPDTLKRDLNGALYTQAGVILEKAQEKSPVDEGVLRDQGQVIGDVAAGVAIVFGGLAAAYAEVQHENDSYHHDQGKAHFLYGAPDSAYEESLGEVTAQLEDAAVQIAIGALTGGLMR